ncbi:MAG: glycosyltransferase [Gemmatimonadaceae bacterium]|nr:glycosyltransferase [Gemmatimonadaceae bacterium]
MNVLFFTHSFPRDDGDAAGSFVLRLAKSLAAEGVGVRVVAPAASGLSAHTALDGVEVERFRYAPRRYETLAYGGNMAEQVRDTWSARFTLVGFLGAEFQAGVRARREFQPSLVHAHWWFPNGLAASWVARMAGIPLVTTLHGTDVRMARNVPVSRPAFRHVMQHSAVVTAVSQWLATEAQSVVSMRAPVVAPMPVATDLFTAGTPSERGTRLLFVGRLTRQKGLDVLIDAFALLPADIGLDVVGAGPERAALESRVAERGVADRVRWHGALRPNELAPFYQRAAAVVVPSNEEGLGLVAVEAQLCETPVVGFASGGLPDVVQDGRTGVLVSERSAAALASGIQALLAREDRGLTLGAAGRLHALATFAPESVAKRYAEIYRTALGHTTT